MVVNLGLMDIPNYCRQLTSASNLDQYPECNQTGGVDLIGETPETVTLNIPGIYSNPGGIISNQAELLRLAMGGAPSTSGPSTPAASASAFPLSKNTVWLLAAAAVAVIVVSKR